MARRTTSLDGKELTFRIEGQVPDGSVLSIEDNNRLKAFYSYKNNQRNGIMVRFYPDGNIYLIAYDKDDTPICGRAFYSSGKLESEWAMIDSASQGIGYHENGNIMELINYKDENFQIIKFDKEGKRIE